MQAYHILSYHKILNIQLIKD